MGYINSNMVLYQENIGVILLKKIGKIPISKITKRINTRFYFITNRINKEYTSVKCCPTEEVVGEYLTKPLQGKLFLKFCSLNRESELMSIS